MFRSVQHKLYFYTALLVPAVAATTVCFLTTAYFYAAAGLGVIVFCFLQLETAYKRYHHDLNFLLSALENGDYAFHFPETQRSSREAEINAVMNRIKKMLAKARQEVIENETFLSLILESISTGILIIDDRGTVQRANQTALQMLGFSIFSHINQLQTIDKTWPQLFHQLKAGDRTQITLPTEREEIQISLQTSQILLKRGMMRLISLNNIGNELETKEMESWIRLIRVMTHEIMNAIAPITSLTETLHFMHQSSSRPPEELRQNTLEALETINTTASGLLSFVESYRKFTAVPKPKKQNFNLNVLIEKVIKLHETAIRKKNIDSTVSFPESEPFILFADENLVSQVLINLVKNAIEAVEADKGEKIILSVGRQAPDRLSVHVANSGQAIPPDILPHIFVPFFTTKPSGSGVGLSVSRYIMRLHGGKLQHSTSKDGLTVFSMIF
jgi:nitrogen fixation/metabolism regulation signal transduction histidine kinase